MTTPCELVQIEYQGNGTLSVFPFPFPYDFKTEVKVALWNNTTKKHEDILTTDATYPWEVSDANPTAVTFTGTVPPSPPTPDVNEDPIFNVRIYRVTNMTDIRSVFNQGSAIRATDLNKNFEQLRYAIQEGKCQIPDKLLEYLDQYYWNNYSDVVYSTETWVSNDQTLATTAALDARFQDELSETITSAEAWPNNDDTIATTAKIDDVIDLAIETDIIIDATGLTKSASGGQTTIGIGANSVDLDRIKTDDVVDTSAYSSTWVNEDDKIATVGAIAKRHDLTISTSAPTTTQLGTLWYNNTIGVNSLNMWDGSGWKVVTSGTPYIPQGTTIVRYVDKVNGSNASDVTGFLPQAPLKSIERALELVNASVSGDGTLIVIAPGVYQETLPLRIEKNNVSIIGTSLRSCFVHPTVATETNSMFEVTSGSYITNLTLLGLKVPTVDQGSRNNSLDNDATYGLPSNQPFAVRFRTDIQPIILKSPYIQNCTHFSDAHFDNANFDPNTFPSTDAQTYSAVAGDETSAPCGGGLLIDGAAVSSSSPIRSMVVDAFTQICLDGPGVLVTNNGYAQLVSFFGTFTHYHAKAKNGGQINLSNCVSDFGRYGLIADGKSPAAIATATISSPSVGAGSGSTTVTIGALTQGTFHGSVSQPLNHMMITIDGVDYGVVSSVANGSGWDVTLTSGLTGNITSTAAAFALRSYISTGGHTFEFVGVGTDYSDHPDEGGVPIEANQVIELNGGKVWQSSTDHVGKFKAGNVLVVDQVSETVDLKDTTVTGNIIVTGTVDGRDVAADGTKLDGIESGATGDQTASEIRALVQSATDSNVFTDADHTKLNGIESGATADQTASEIKTAYESNADTNEFSDAEQSKLAGIAAGAEVNVNADWNSSSGDSEILNKPTIPAAYTDSSVDTHLNTSTASSNEVLSWTGSDYDWVAQSGGGGGAVDSVNTQTGVVVLDADDISDTSTTNKFTTAGEAAKLAGIATGAIANVVEDTTPQLGGPLDVQAQEINTSTTNGNIKLTPDGTGVVEIKGNTGNDAAIQLNCEQNTHGVKIKSPPHSAAASYTLTLPDDTGTSNQLLTTDGSGNLSWSSSGGITDSSGSSTSIGIGSSTALDAETTSGNYNIAIGANALTELTAGHGNIAIGLDAFKSMVTSNISSFGSIAIGSNAGYSFLSTGGGIFGNCYIGFSAGRLSGTTGQPGAVTHVGSYAGQYDSGNNSTSFGYRALSGMGSTVPSTGHNNIYSTAIGAYSLLSSTGSDFCTAVGTFALTAATATSSNTAIGSKSLEANTTGDSNTAVGANSGLLAQGDYNTFIGYNAGDQLVGAAGNTGQNNIIIGYDAQASSTTVNNEITLGNVANQPGDPSITKFRIPGINFILKENASLPSTGQVLTADSNGEGYWADAGSGPATVDTTSLDTNFAINPDNGTMLIDQITANRTYTDDMASGESVTIMVSRSSVNHSITWPTIKWVGGSQPILPSGSAAYAIITVWKAGTTLFGSYGGDAS